MASRRINLPAPVPLRFGDTPTKHSLNYEPSFRTAFGPESPYLISPRHKFRTLVQTNRWPLRLLLSLCAFVFLSRTVPAHAAPPLSPADIEAAYLYNFGKFIEWPAPTDLPPAPFSICVVGKDDFGATLSSLVHNDTVNGHTIVAKHLPSIAEADACQILFLGSSEEAHLAKDLDILKDKPILTVSSIPGFLDRGGMIQFLVRDSRVRFAVNLGTATHAHLTLSSELLKVAVYVHPKPTPEGQ